VAEPDPDKNQNAINRRTKHWVRHAITLLLLTALVVTGTAAYFARQQWWSMYMSFTHR
jgi:hypothetical protein